MLEGDVNQGQPQDPQNQGDSSSSSAGATEEQAIPPTQKPLEPELVQSLAPPPAPVKEATKTITYIVAFIFLLLFIGVPYELSAYFAAPATRYTALINDTLVNPHEFFFVPALSEELFECASRYRNQTAAFKVLRFCKLYYRQYPFGGFKDYIMYVGKSFVNSTDCYALAAEEFFVDVVQQMEYFFQKIKVKPPKVEYLELGGTYVVAELYEATSSFCPTIGFKTAEQITLNSGNETVQLGSQFVFSRAITYSSICGGYQRIPALYSIENKKCFFGVAVGAPARVTSTCEIYCHTDFGETDKRDPQHPFFVTN